MNSGGIARDSGGNSRDSGVNGRNEFFENTKIIFWLNWVRAEFGALGGILRFGQISWLNAFRLKLLTARRSRYLIIYDYIRTFFQNGKTMQSIKLTLLCPFEKKPSKTSMQWAHETWHQLVRSRVETTASETGEILGWFRGFNTSPQTITPIGQLGLPSKALKWKPDCLGPRGSPSIGARWMISFPLSGSLGSNVS